MDAIELEMMVEGAIDQVFAAMTDQIDRWWMLGFFSPDSTIHLEPSAGGKFYENFGGGKGQALYATVTYIEPPAKIRMSGPMGVRGPVLGTIAYDLAPLDGTTRLTLAHRIIGQVEEGTRETYTAGWQQLLAQLKMYVEAGQGYRDQA